MREITTRLLTEPDLAAVGKQIAVSYNAAYHGLMLYCN